MKPLKSEKNIKSVPIKAYPLKSGPTKSFSPGKPVVETAEPEPKPEKPAGFECPICHCILDTEELLRKHLHRQHSQGVINLNQPATRDGSSSGDPVLEAERKKRDGRLPW